MTIENISRLTSTKDVIGPGQDQTRDLLITSQTCIQLRHQAWLVKK